MSRQKYEKTFNTFTKGLMTEASELNFPEDFSLYEKNFLLHRDGGRDRRKGMELVYPLGLTLTSTLYPIEFEDGTEATGRLSSGHISRLWRQSLQDSSTGSASLVGGEHRTTVLSLVESEYSKVGSFALVSGEHRENIVRYTIPSDSTQGSAVLEGGEFRRTVIRYSLNDFSKGLITGVSGEFSAPYDVTVAPSGLAASSQVGGIQLTWNNSSRILVDQLLYKSTTPFDENNLPYPERIGNSVLNFLDEDVQADTEYWYAVGSEGLGGNIILSPVISHTFTQLEGIDLKFEGGYVPDDWDSIDLKFTE